ncbi:MAG: hypothetical protein HY695_37875 [Deltaproteobacteria bacterium]|nr:hypothetical protein [Deltaproteobacteria bacterium]
MKDGQDEEEEAEEKAVNESDMQPTIELEEANGSMVRTAELEKKAWYRFFKLCYVFAYVVSVCVVLLISYFDFPTEYIDSTSSIILCENGKRYLATANSIYPTSTELDSDDDQKARWLCFDIVGSVTFIPDEPPRNYTFIPVKTTRGSYQPLFWGLGIVIFLGEIIRRSFLYVVVGRPFSAGGFHLHVKKMKPASLLPPCAAASQA